MSSTPSLLPDDAFGAPSEDTAPDDSSDIRSVSGPSRGGGPPGGSAFNRGGRLRRISARPAGRQTPVVAPESEPRPEPTRSAFLDDDQISHDISPDVSTNTSTDAPVGPVTATTTQFLDPNRPAIRSRPRTSTGYSSLPRLGSPATTEPTVQFVGTAFVRANPEDPDDQVDEPHSGYDEYFTFESLFEDPPETEAPLGKSEDPYDILGITPSTPWAEIVSVKRRLVKEHHPDHLGDASCEERLAAEDRLRLINWAYTQVRTDHGH